MNHQNLKGLNEKIALCKKIENQSFRPEIYRLSNNEDRAKLEDLLDSSQSLRIHDRIGEQLKELFKIRNPKIAYTDKDLDNLLQEWTTKNSLQDYGIWVYYPWKSLLIHLVDRDEFIELRTSRNQYKITPAEQEELSDKIVGVIGLSVGQSVAVTLSIERGYGTIRIADFDTLELTNLNRIRRGLDSLGQKKTTMVAREIAEIDPFLNVEVFDKGIDEENINAFLTQNGKMNLLIEECDSLDIKILARIEAKKLEIPVLMDTSDKGMIDIERFDLEPTRPIFHGKIALDDPAQLKDLSYEEKIPFILDLIGVPQMSYRLKSSMLEVGESISTWPQLASDVTLGGAITAKIARQILLGEKVNSGRFYTEGEDLWIEEERENSQESGSDSWLEIEAAISQLETPIGTTTLNEDLEDELLKAALSTDSFRNSQPWKIFKKQQAYYAVLDKSRIGLNGENRQSAILSIGGMIRKMQVLASHKALETEIIWFPDPEQQDLVAQIGFQKLGEQNKNKKIPGIDSSNLNKHLFDPVEVSKQFYKDLSQLIASASGLEVHVNDNAEGIEKLANAAAKIHIHGLLDRNGHRQFFNHIRWDESSVKEFGDGYFIDDLLVKPQERMVLEIIKSWKVASLLARQNLGKGLGVFTKMAVQSSSALVLISMKSTDEKRIVEAGHLLQDIWSLTSKYGYALDTLPQVCSFFNQNKLGSLDYVSDLQRQELEEIVTGFPEIFDGYDSENNQLYLLRVGKEKMKMKLNYRRSLSKVYQKLNSD